MLPFTQIKRRSFLSMLAILGGSGLHTSFGSARAETPLLPLNVVTPSGSNAHVFQELMKRGKYYELYGVSPKVTDVSDGAKVLAGLLSGDADLCLGSGFGGLFPAIERGAKIKILAGAILVSATCIYTKRPDIQSTKDLAGRTFGTGALGALLHELIVALLIKKGIDYNTVKFVNVGSNLDIFRAVAAGTIDAGLGSFDFYGQQKKYDVHALTDGALWDQLPEYTDQAMFASDRAISERREAIVRAMAANAEMFRFVASPESREAFIEARATALGKNDVNDALTQWRFFQAPGRLATNLLLTEDKTAYIQRLNVMLGSQRKVLPFREVADMSLAQDAVSRLRTAR